MQAETGAALRAALASAPRQGAGRAYPRELRARAAAYARRRRAEGVSDGQIGRELGLAAMTFHRWAGARGSAFAPATIATTTSATASAAVVVHGPRGLRIEGLDLVQIAELWSRLA